MKTWTKILIGSLLILSVLVGYVIFDNYGFCWKPFNKDYFKWFPYTTGDTLVFKSDNSEKKYIVSYYLTQHNNTYLKHAQCGCCEESISMSLKSKNDTIDIVFMNFGNPENCFGEYLNIGKYIAQNYTNHNELIVRTKKENNIIREYISIQKDTFLITKSIGLSSFIFQNKTFYFRKIIKSKGEITKQSNHCN